MKKRLFNFLLLFMPLWAKFFKTVAITGQGSDICLENGFLPMNVHYYSPIPDLFDLQKRQVWNKKSELPGIDFQIDRQIQLLLALGANYGNECNWPSSPTKNPFDFYTENNTFSYGCAASLYSIIRYYKPKRIIEIGSGNSSLIFSSALSRNQEEGVYSQYIIIDPYPSPTIETGFSNLAKVIKERVELTAFDCFEELEANDILFIDSGHTVRTGGDVNFLFLEVLPRLAPGVIVHVHDISLPYEYPEVYFTNPSFRMFWTEAYLLQAFLAFNSEFEVMLALGYLMKDKMSDFRKAFPRYDPDIHKAISGSFWIRRKK